MGGCETTRNKIRWMRSKNTKLVHLGYKIRAARRTLSITRQGGHHLRPATITSPFRQVQRSDNTFFWRSALKPIGARVTPFAPDFLARARPAGTWTGNESEETSAGIPGSGERSDRPISSRVCSLRISLPHFRRHRFEEKRRAVASSRAFARRPYCWVRV
jgi:hypothetical protein